MIQIINRISVVVVRLIETKTDIAVHKAKASAHSLFNIANEWTDVWLFAL